MKTHTGKLTRGAVALAGWLVLAFAAGTAWAKDSITVTVTNATNPTPVIVENGKATGTIQLFYTVNAYQYTLGQFATFDVDWVISQDSRNPTDYGAGIRFQLSQDQQGGNVDLSPNPASFNLTAAGQSGKSTVTVFIVNDKDGNPPPSADGTDLVGNLKLETDPNGKVNTVTSIQVHIKLVYPTNCLKVYNFVTDQDYNMGILSTTSVNVFTSGPKTGQVKSSYPGQYSDNVLLANTCPTNQAFDLRIGLDPSFETNPSGNPGNAVFTYSTSGEVDPSSFSISSFGTGTAQGQQLCLQNVPVAAGTTFLATVHSQVKKGPNSLPSDGTFDFSATLYQNVNSGCDGALDTMASPNPAGVTLPFTIN